MFRIFRLAVTLAFAGTLALPQEPIRGFPASEWAPEHKLEQDAQTIPNPENLRRYMREIATEPHHAGSPGALRVAEYLRDQMTGWGLDAVIEESESLLPYPTDRTLELLGDRPYKARLEEPAVDGDPDTSDAGQLPPFNAFSASGDVTAPLVYVNYGLQEDYDYLASKGISVRGKIVLVRYGESWRGLKPRLAEEHGAVGCIIYSDPRDDGFFTDDTYPYGEARPAGGVQRGSVVGMEIYPGDPLTPGWASEPGGKRLERKDAASLLHIPVLPISWSDASPFLEALGGPIVPENWRGAVPVTYHAGPSQAPVHLKAEFDWSTRPLRNVITTIPGTEFPNEWIIFGNHHDAWVTGASDPISGASALLETARTLAEMMNRGWRPKRTIKLALWDGEEYGLIGSTEWVERHMDELEEKASVYINTDSNGAGDFGASGSHALEPFINEVLRDVRAPHSEVSLLTAIHDAQSNPSAKEIRPVRIGSLGAGSDYVAFLHHAGIASLNLGFAAERGQYHSIYDTVAYYNRFSDVDRSHGVALSQTTTTMILRLADATVLPFDFSELSDTLRRYVGELRGLGGGPGRVSLVNLQRQVDRLAAAGRAYEAALNGILRQSATISPDQLRAINDAVEHVERTLTLEDGLPDRPWYRHQLYAPGLMTGYSAKTLPGVREAMEAKDWRKARQQTGRLESTLRNTVSAVDDAVKLMRDSVRGRARLSLCPSSCVLFVVLLRVVFRFQFGLGLIELFQLIFRQRRVAGIQFAHGVINERTHRQPHEPFVIGGNDVPGRPLRAGRLQHLLIGLLIFVPVLAFFDVTPGELPVFLRLVDPIQKPLFLFFLGYVQEALQNVGPIFGHVFFEVVDLLETLLPDAFGIDRLGQALRLQDLRMNADHQHFLVIRTVEDADVAAPGHA